MAQTKKKRKSKHRGNAAGMVEARGRTGRKPTSDEKSGKSGRDSKSDVSGVRPHRLDRPPTWKGAMFRAAVASASFFAVLVLFFKRPAQPSAVVAVLMILVYTPLGYVTDMWIHKRRLAKKAKNAEKPE
jgi:hypothetical protein